MKKWVRNKIGYLVLAVLIIVFVSVLGYFLVSEKVKEGKVGMSPEQDGKIRPYIVNSYRIEYRMPSYLPEELKYPQHFFSGRELNIINEKEENEKGKEIKSDKIKTVRLVKKDLKANKILEEKDVETKLSKRQATSAFVIDIPKDLETGDYEIQFDDNGLKALPIRINGLYKNNKNSLADGVQLSPVGMDPSIIDIKRMGCISYSQCYWELAFAINPLDENYQYLVGLGLFGLPNIFQTKDGWQTQTNLYIDAINPYFKEYKGDPKIAFTSDGKLVLASLFEKNILVISGGIYEEIQSKSLPLQMTQKILSDPQNLDLSYSVIFDYPKIAIDTSSISPYYKSTYVFAGSIYFEDIPDPYTKTYNGFYTIRDGIVTLTREGGGAGKYYGPQPDSITLGPNGEIYIGDNFSPQPPYNFVYFYYSLDGGKTFSESHVSSYKVRSFQPRVSTTSNRASWVAPLFHGPEIAVDKNGRVYVVWGDAQEIREDLNFEYRYYAYNYDIYTAYSDDQGKTWSNPIKVNDDNSGGDQGFPNIKIDDDGIVYVVFLDHRDNQDKDQYDVYLAYSTDRGKTFSKNIRINDINVQNVLGGRQPGDYLDMLAVGKDKIYIAHPCEKLIDDSPKLPSDACVTIIDKNKLLGIVNVDQNFCSTHQYYSSATSVTNQSCCFAGNVTKSNTIATGDQYNRFLCYNGR